MTDLTVGYLQVGPPEHGICRYGRLLATEGRSRGDVAVVQHDVLLGKDGRSNKRVLLDAARVLSKADIVHTQVSVYSEGTWGSGWRALSHLRLFQRRCNRPLVITLHDTNTFEIPRARRLIKLLVRVGLESVQMGTHSTLDSLAPFFVAKWVIRHAAATLVLTRAELSRLRLLQGKHIVRMIPHFVEPATPAPADLDSAPPAQRTIIVPGFIFRGKGHGLMLEAMQFLQHVTVVFLGGPSLGGSEEHARILSLAHDLGVMKRLKITGHLPEVEYQRYLQTADLAVCPFDETKSASSSIASLISAGCPILASDIPLIWEYNAIAPGAIHTFSPYTAEALAQAVRALLPLPRTTLAQKLTTLQHELAISRVYKEHIGTYMQALHRG